MTRRRIIKKVVDECIGCVKVTRNFSCAAFKDPRDMWRNGSSCWGHTEKPDDLVQIYNGLKRVNKGNTEVVLEILGLIRLHG